MAKPIPVSKVRTTLEAFIPKHGPLSDQQLNAQALLAVLPADPNAMILDPYWPGAALCEAQINCGRTHLKDLGLPRDHEQDATVILSAALRLSAAAGSKR
jgi:hypothetical protein